MLTANIILDARGHIKLWNARAQLLFGYARENIVGRSFAVLLEQGKGPADAVLQSAAAVGYADVSADGLREDGGRFPAQALITSLGDAASGDLSLVVWNVTEQSQAQQKSRDENARFVSIIQSAMDPMITVDEDQKIVLFNSAAEKTFRCAAAVALNDSLERFLPQRYRAAHRGHIERFAATGVTMRRMGEQRVLVGLRADGDEFPLEASISQVTIEGRKLFTVILRDVTERQRARDELELSHTRLRELYAAMHEVREAERTRVARELHDELAQWLTALKMDAAWLAARLPREPGVGDRMTRILGVIDTTVASVRRIAADLRPLMLDDLGLVPAIEDLLHGFEERTGLVTRLEVADDDIEVREPHATAVYRMVQEALTNVARHAQASEVSTTLRFDGTRLEVSVRDNGKGMAPTAPSSAKSFGLLGIRERAQTLGGAAKIHSPSGGGTVVEISLPIGDERPAGVAR